MLRAALALSPHFRGNTPSRLTGGRHRARRKTMPTTRARRNPPGTTTSSTATTPGTAAADGERRTRAMTVTPESRIVYQGSAAADGEGDIPVETVVLGAREDVKAPLDIVIIPGNPGVPSFYATYAVRLWELLEGRANIEIVGYLGHSTDNLGVKGWFTLQQQLDHVVAYLRDRRAKVRCSASFFFLLRREMK